MDNLGGYRNVAPDLHDMLVSWGAWQPTTFYAGMFFLVERI